MFESMTDRIAGTLIMGLDVAVEFATLGEFRLVDPSLASASTPYTADAAPLVRRPPRLDSAQADRSLLPAPATAIARASLPDARASLPDDLAPIRLRMPPRASLRPVLPPAHARTRPATPMRTAAKPPVRSRGGAVKPGAQLCLFGR
jgi:hypothetical protein